MTLMPMTLMPTGEIKCIIITMVIILAMVWCVGGNGHLCGKCMAFYLNVMEKTRDFICWSVCCNGQSLVWPSTRQWPCLSVAANRATVKHSVTANRTMAKLSVAASKAMAKPWSGRQQRNGQGLMWPPTRQWLCLGVATMHQGNGHALV